MTTTKSLTAETRARDTHQFINRSTIDALPFHLQTGTNPGDLDGHSKRSIA